MLKLLQYVHRTGRPVQATYGRRCIMICMRNGYISQQIPHRRKKTFADRNAVLLATNIKLPGPSTSQSRMDTHLHISNANNLKCYRYKTFFTHNLTKYWVYILWKNTRQNERESTSRTRNRTKPAIHVHTHTRTGNVWDIFRNQSTKNHVTHNTSNECTSLRCNEATFNEVTRYSSRVVTLPSYFPSILIYPQ